jgi:hypothetical protein
VTADKTEKSAGAPVQKGAAADTGQPSVVVARCSNTCGIQECPFGDEGERRWVGSRGDGGERAVHGVSIQAGRRVARNEGSEVGEVE